MPRLDTSVYGQLNGPSTVVLQPVIILRSYSAAWNLCTHDYNMAYNSRWTVSSCVYFHRVHHTVFREDESECFRAVTACPTQHYLAVSLTLKILGLTHIWSPHLFLQHGSSCKHSILWHNIVTLIFRVAYRGNAELVPLWRFMRADL